MKHSLHCVAEIHIYRKDILASECSGYIEKVLIYFVYSL